MVKEYLSLTSAGQEYRMSLCKTLSLSLQSLTLPLVWAHLWITDTSACKSRVHQDPTPLKMPLSATVWAQGVVHSGSTVLWRGQTQQRGLVWSQKQVRAIWAKKYVGSSIYNLVSGREELPSG